MKTVTTKTRNGRRFAIGPLLMLFTFAAVPLGVGGALLYMRHHAIVTMDAATGWQETPCVIEVCEIKSSDEDDYLDFVFQYEVDGLSYRSDRLDAVIGRFGDDDLFEEWIHESYPPGATAVCFVNPDDPNEVIFNREHRSDAPRRLFLLAFPFVVVGLLFFLLFLAALLLPDRKADVASHHERVHGLLRDKHPPRSFSIATRMAVLAGPASSQLAWLFLVGFIFVFVIMDGPAQWMQLLDIDRDQLTVTGVVDDVRTVDASELGMQVYQYLIVYEIDGEEFEVPNFMRGRRYAEGDAIPIRVDPNAPEKGVLLGARSGELSWWHSAIPLGVILLLVFGLTSMFLLSRRVLRLLRIGMLAEAQPLRGHLNAQGGDAQHATMRSNFSFEIDGNHYPALRFSSSEKLKQNQSAVVLFDPKNPARNVVLGNELCNTIASAETWSGWMQQCAVGPLALVALGILYWGAF